MPMSPAELRFLFNRATGLFHRGVTSLRTRGLRASWHRVLRQFQRVPVSQRPSLYMPAPMAFAPFAVPSDAAPRASLVIPVFNQFEHTLRCLRALAEHPPAVAIELIVVDDGSSDETSTLLPQVEGLRYHRRATNGGFIAACNDGAGLARGEVLVFLNNDTVPQPGWLEALLGTFGTHPDSGLVGAQLLYPDGRLQESGAAIRADGSAEKLGRNEDTDAPLHAFVKRVDYCSGAAVAIPATLFRELGGFDTRYAPAFYEDTDLAMQVRRSGWQVRIQPGARVVHVEGATTGVDTRTGVKQYQVRNQALFRERWDKSLSTHPDAAATPPSLTDHRYAGMVLVIDALTPRPDRDSGSLRSVNLMRMLLQEGKGVVFVPANLSRDGDYTRELQQLGVEVWFAPFVGGFPAWLRAHGRRFETVVVSRHYVLGELLPLLGRFAPQAKVVFDTVDLHYLRERRGAQMRGDAALLRAAERTRRSELDLINRSDVTLVVSEAERALLAEEAPQARVEVLSNLHELKDPGLPFDQRKDVVFVGGFRHPPNVDAVQWFADEVWPRLHAAEPDMVFHCIGDDVPPGIQALAGRPGIRVHGHVPDIEPYMAGARVAVAPLRFGAGVKGKVNLSMAHGQPVVATSCAVEGMHLQDGEDVLVANAPEDFVAAVLRAYRDPALWSRLASNGRDNVAKHFSLDAGRAVVQRLLRTQGPAAEA
ncbi:glycosyl transferase [Lysobacter daejeonensis GH1-9]|uniref:Glycosyl transferase n=1 Tax=Lysobacter daejeonensis GH1-9 TaxID=1385517 RepID=A0A0A0EWM1_9GAMM|nr:glycosyltransferase [Lysobacter daejeonensis]KGM54685.1 glycosyl transferase [Lysobacter daejeonensis GH1-9]